MRSASLLIDVYPDDIADKAMAGYVFPVAIEIFPGRYLHEPATGAALTAGKVERHNFTLPVADHVFAKGHRIAVQTQSSWFPFTIAIRSALSHRSSTRDRRTINWRHRASTGHRVPRRDLAAGDRRGGSRRSSEKEGLKLAPFPS